MKYKLKDKEIELTDEEVQEIIKISKGDVSKGDVVGVTIKRWDIDEVIYASTKSTMKEAVEKAVTNRASLAYADLSNTNLSNADLSNADLRNANLRNTDLYNATFYGKGGEQKLTKEQVPTFLEALGFIIEE